MKLSTQEREKIYLEVLEVLKDDRIIDDKHIYTYYWDYRELLGEEAITEILEEYIKPNLKSIKEYKSIEEFVDVMTNAYIYDKWGVYEHCEQDIYNSIYKQLEEYELEEDDRMGLIDDIRDAISIDTDIYWIVSRSYVDDIAIVLTQNNWDDDYFVEDRWNDYYKDRNIESVVNSQIFWLLLQFGCNPEWLFDEQKLSENGFLRSVKEELYDYYNNLYGCLLTFVLKGNLYDLTKICYYDNIKLDKKVTVGLFNYVQGRGSGLNIELDKDVIIHQKDIYNVLLRSKTYYNPFEVYGKFPTYEALIIEQE